MKKQSNADIISRWELYIHQTFSEMNMQDKNYCKRFSYYTFGELFSLNKCNPAPLFYDLLAEDPALIHILFSLPKYILSRIYQHLITDTEVWLIYFKIIRGDELLSDDKIKLIETFDQFKHPHC